MRECVCGCGGAHRVGACVCVLVRACACVRMSLVTPCAELQHATARAGDSYLDEVHWWKRVHPLLWLDVSLWCSCRPGAAASLQSALKQLQTCTTGAGSITLRLKTVCVVSWMPILGRTCLGGAAACSLPRYPWPPCSKQRRVGFAGEVMAPRRTNRWARLFDPRILWSAWQGSPEGNDSQARSIPKPPKTCQLHTTIRVFGAEVRPKWLPASRFLVPQGQCDWMFDVATEALSSSLSSSGHIVQTCGTLQQQQLVMLVALVGSC